MNKKTCLFGHFGFGSNLLNGQTIKTKIISNTLKENLGSEFFVEIDTSGGILTILKILFNAIRYFSKFDNLIIMPAQRGLFVFVPLLYWFNKFFDKKLIYIVIGGWLPDYVKKYKFLCNMLKSFDFIYCETNTMKFKLNNCDLENVTVMQNCKKLSPLDQSDLIYFDAEPYRICTFSRVMFEKGIEDIVNAVEYINKQFSRTVFCLDIYGAVDPEQRFWFENLQKSFPEYVKYIGEVPFDKSVEVLKHYFALVFPTRYYTEGVPGTILDAYAAGIPVICSKWESFYDVIDENVTGIGYEFCNFNELCKILMEVCKNPERLNSLKINCLRKSRMYLPENTLGILLKELK